MDKVIYYLKDKRNFEVLFCVILLVVLLSVASYGLSVGETKNIFTVGGITVNQLYVGDYTVPPIIPSSNGSILLLLALPLELAGIIIVILALRMRSVGTIKAIVLTLAMAIFLIITFLVINSMLNVFR